MDAQRVASSRSAVALDEAARKAVTAPARTALAEKVAGLDEAALKAATAHLYEARLRSGKWQFLPPELLAMATEVNRRDPGRRTYEDSRAWTPWVRAYNVRARVTEGWEVVEDESKAAVALRKRCLGKGES